MPKGAYALMDIDWPVVRLYCSQCHRFTQFKRTTLLQRFGLGRPMPTILGGLKPCDAGNSLSGPQCQLRYWDSMAPEVRAEAIAKGGMPESWIYDEGGEVAL